MNGSYVSGGSAAGSRETTAATNYAGCQLDAGWASCDAKSIAATSTIYNYAGGQVGAVNGSGARRGAVNDSYADGDVAVNTTSFVNAAGRLIGSANSGDGVTRSYATSNGRLATGGLVGDAIITSVVSQSFAAGNITASGANGGTVGGLVGHIDSSG